MVNCVAVFVLGYLSLAWISIWFIWCVWVILFSKSISFVKSCDSKNCQHILVVLFLIYLFLVLIWMVNLIFCFDLILSCIFIYSLSSYLCSRSTQIPSHSFHCVFEVYLFVLIPDFRILCFHKSVLTVLLYEN